MRTVQVTVTLQGVAPHWWERVSAAELKERIENDARRLVQNNIGERLVSFTVTATATGAAAAWETLDQEEGR